MAEGQGEGWMDTEHFMPSPTFVGIDLGTQSVRAIVIDSETGAVIAAATAEYPLLTPEPQWAEQDPADWWRASQTAISRALELAGDRAADLAGLGLTGQMHGLVLLDERDSVVRPAILWCDQRTERQCAEITERVGAERLVRITGNPALTGFQAPKVLWLRDEEAANFDRVAQCCCRRITFVMS